MKTIFDFSRISAIYPDVVDTQFGRISVIKVELEKGYYPTKDECEALEVRGWDHYHAKYHKENGIKVWDAKGYFGHHYDDKIYTAMLRELSRVKGEAYQPSKKADKKSVKKSASKKPAKKVNPRPEDVDWEWLNKVVKAKTGWTLDEHMMMNGCK